MDKIEIKAHVYKQAREVVIKVMGENNLKRAIDSHIKTLHNFNEKFEYLTKMRIDELKSMIEETIIETWTSILLEDANFNLTDHDYRILSIYWGFVVQHE